MPRAPKRPCTYPGCGALVDTSSRCDAHRRVEQRELDQRRGSSTARGYDSKWRKAREGWLRSHPLCQCDECKGGELRVRVATVVDHIKPHRGDMTLFWDRNNWQSMAKACHDKKTAREDGGFGNARNE
jgi:5-methylcytosine-specific restriction protein A